MRTPIRRSKDFCIWKGCGKPEGAKAPGYAIFLSFKLPRMKITQSQKRFLIVWFCINLFALIVNIVPIEGKLTSNDSLNSVYWFTREGDSKKFWPFTNYVDNWTRPKGNNYGLFSDAGDFSVINKSDLEHVSRFNGFFHSYDISEFMVYTILGIAIIFVPKIWNN